MHQVSVTRGFVSKSDIMVTGEWSLAEYGLVRKIKWFK